MISGKTIFIAPVDWGAGHATRCVQIIRDLLPGNKILIGVTEKNRSFFEFHFPDLIKVKVPSYNIRYARYLPLWMKLAMQAPRIAAVIRNENRVLKKIISDYNIDYVLSDNRFGFYHERVHSVFITHQLNIKAPFFSAWINEMNKRYIHCFHEVWVPDYESATNRLSGELTNYKDIRIPVKFIGPKSALAHLPEVAWKEKQYDYLILLSGVEPQRSILEKLLLQKFSASGKQIALVRGRAGIRPEQHYPHITQKDVAYGMELKQMILASDTIICRSGYSSLMDLHELNMKKLILIPTPGQTEQEYLAEYWQLKFGARRLHQTKITEFNFEK